MSETTIEWTPAARRRITVWRGMEGIPKSAKPLEAIDMATYRGIAGDRHWYKRFEGHPELAAQLERAGRWKDGRALDAAAEGVFLSVTGGNAWSSWTRHRKRHQLVVGMMQLESCGFVVDAFMAMATVDQLLDPKHIGASWTTRHLEAYLLHIDMLDALPLVRRQLALCAEDEYEGALARARAYWAEHTSLRVRLPLAYLFPDEPGWGDEACALLPELYSASAEELSSRPEILGCAGLLYGTGASLESLAGVTEKLFSLDPASSVQRVFVHELHGFRAVYDLLARHGVAAVGVLTDLYAREWGRHPDDVAGALSCVRHAPQVVRVYVDRLAALTYRASDHDVEMRYLHDHPELASAAVERALASGQDEPLLEDVAADLRAQIANISRERERADLYVDLDTLPAALARPPWRDASRKPSKPSSAKKPKASKNLEPLDHPVTWVLGAGVDPEERDRVVTRRRLVLGQLSSLGWSAP